MIKNILFDLGGVVVTLDHQEAVRRFTQLGLKQAADELDPYTQGGIFGELESGGIDADGFMDALGRKCGRKVSYNECLDAWLGYRKEVPARNLEALGKLREEGYRLILVSNTNPFMMAWADSGDFDGKGNPISRYFDSLYLSYKMGLMKPDPSFFSRVLMHEGIAPSETLFVDDGPRNVAAASQMGIHTFCPANGEDWTAAVDKILEEEKGIML